MNNSESMRGFYEDLQAAVRDNPVPAALIGVGALWMLMGGGRTTAAAGFVSGAASRAADTFSPVARSVADGARSMTDGLSNLASRASDAAGETIEAAKNTATSAMNTATGALRQTGDELASGAESAQRSVARGATSVANTGSAFADSVQSNLTETFERQPLLVGLIGAAIGAAIATAFPKTRIEEEYIGETAANVKGKVETFAKDQSQKLQQTAERTLEAVKQEATAQGLTPGTLKQGVSAIRDKAVSAASAARRNGQNPR